MKHNCFYGSVQGLGVWRVDQVWNWTSVSATIISKNRYPAKTLFSAHNIHSLSICMLTKTFQYNNKHNPGSVPVSCAFSKTFACKYVLIQIRWDTLLNLHVIVILQIGKICRPQGGGVKDGNGGWLDGMSAIPFTQVDSFHSSRPNKQMFKLQRGISPFPFLLLFFWCLWVLVPPLWYDFTGFHR